MAYKENGMPSTNNPVLDAIFARRSIRKFTEEPVSGQDLTTLAEAVRWAPSGGNRQPWRLVFLKEGDPRKRVVAAFSKYANILNAANVVAVMTLDRNACYDAIKDCQVAGAGLQNLLIAAHALGLGAVWIGDVVDMGPEVLGAAGLPADSLQFMALVAIGHPAENGHAKRKELSSFLLESI